MRFRRSTLMFVALALSFALPGFASPQQFADPIAWYDTLGYPDVKDLPYVRVATGLSIQEGNQPPENTYVEGFLVEGGADAFTVFICSVPDLKDSVGGADDPYPALTTVRFVGNTTGPESEQVKYEILDFNDVASGVLRRVQAEAGKPQSGNLRGGYFITTRSRVFAFARATLQKGLTDIADNLMGFAAMIPNPSGKADPALFLQSLQQEIGDAFLTHAEKDSGTPEISWAELLKKYEDFERRFPASLSVAYAREAIDALRRMIAQDVSRRSKPPDRMSVVEEVAEEIYELRNLDAGSWVMYQAYPISSSEVDGKIVKTPVHRLVDLGYEAVPQLIEALDDHGFTRSMEPRFNGYALPRALRVSDFAQRILQHISGRYFFAERTPDGTLTKGTVRQQAEAWWAEVQSKGEKQVLLEQAAAGGQSATEAVRKLVEKYPEAATGAIRAALPVASNSLVRGELVSLAAGLEGDEALEFLRSMLAAGVEVPSQVAAAEILFERGHPEAVPAMISVWRNIQPRLPNNENDAWDEVGGVIEFLAKSEDPAAIDALAADLRRTPVDVRLAAVMVYLPWPRAAGQSSEGKGVSARGDIKDLPGGSAGSAIERLLIAALDDKDQRLNLRGDYDEVSYKDPRICDMAALVLAKRWPEKYPFTWSATDMERDAQIALMKSR